jgi:hypothetical protein
MIKFEKSGADSAPGFFCCLSWAYLHICVNVAFSRSFCDIILISYIPNSTCGLP